MPPLICLSALVLVVLACLGTPLRAADPKDPVIEVKIQEQGKGVNGSWKGTHVNRFRLSRIWTGKVGGGMAIGGQTVMVGAGMPSPAALYAVRGSLLGLRVGEELQYYLSEHEGSGMEVAKPGGNRPFSSVLKANGSYIGSMGSDQVNENDFAYRKQEGIPSNANFPGVGRAYDTAISAFRTAKGLDLVLGAGAVGVPSHGVGFPDNDGAIADGLWEEVYADISRHSFTLEELKRPGPVSRARQGSRGKDGDSFSLSVTVTLNPEDDEDEVTVTADGYDTWVPEGNLADPARRGNRLTLQAQVHRKGDPTVPRLANLTFNLKEVSMETGVCLNWPRKGASSYGLKFQQEENPGLDVVGPDQVRTKEDAERATVVVSAFDFGAWGTFEVKAKDARGRELKVRIRGKETSDLSLPLDENHNHIADSWEIANVGDLRGAAGADDEETPAGKPGCPGDGLSLYEEYRGFRVKGGHIRCDPRRRDLFVCDHTAGEVAQSGIDLFEKVTGLKVWRVTYEELGGDRLINRNGGTAHGVDQHGLLIEDSAGGDPQQVATSARSEVFGPPGMTLFVQLPAGRDYASGDAMADTAHELCHAVGICHHGDENLYPVDWSWKLGEDGAWQLWEQVLGQGKDGHWGPLKGKAGTPIQVYFEGGRAFTKADGAPAGSATVGVEAWRLWIGGEQSPFSGDQECLLRYADKQAYLSKREPMRVRYLPDQAQWKARTRLCDSAAGTGVNAPGHAPQSRYGPAVAGNCKARLVVSDKYASGP